MNDNTTATISAPRKSKLNSIAPPSMISIVRSAPSTIAIPEESFCLPQCPFSASTYLPSANTAFLLLSVFHIRSILPVLCSSHDLSNIFSKHIFCMFALYLIFSPIKRYKYGFSEHLFILYKNMFVFKIHKKRMLPAGHSDKQHSFFIHSRYLFQHTTVSQSPLTGQNIILIGK